MTRKINRNYKKGLPFRDFRKFIIICEGKREDDYFKEFNNINRRIQIHIVEREEGQSAVKHLLNRASNYDELFGIEPEDFLWFILDVDRWPKDQISELHQNCIEESNWFIAISNPSFEVWLYYHVVSTIPAELKTASKLKTKLKDVVHGGYNAKKIALLIERAVINAKNTDQNPDYYFPDLHVTKVYQLALQMISFLGKNWKLR